MMKVSRDNGLVTISLSEKDAAAFAIVVLVAVDRQEEVEASDVGVTYEELTLGFGIAEEVNKRFEEMGFHAALQPRGQTEDDEGDDLELDEDDDDELNALADERIAEGERVRVDPKDM